MRKKKISGLVVWLCGWKVIKGVTAKVCGIALGMMKIFRIRVW